MSPISEVEKSVICQEECDLLGKVFLLDAFINIWKVWSAMESVICQ